MHSGGSENKGPSIVEIQRFIREQTHVEFILSNGERLSGKLRWFDDQAFSLVSDGEGPITVLRQAVLAYHPLANK